MLHVIRIKPFHQKQRSPASVLRRLWLDEALYRDPQSRAWLVVESQPRERKRERERESESESEQDQGKPVIVLGLSSRASELVHLDACARDGVSVLRRFTGGGTVALDRDSILVSLTTNTHAGITQPYPRDVMAWTDEVWLRRRVCELLRPGLSFRARENDYVVGEEFKVGGNAQALSLKPGRFLHHTSFLWRAHGSTMAYLRHPDRAPEYRSGRDHLDFVRGLSEFVDGDGNGDDDDDGVSRSDFERAVVEGAADALRLGVDEVEVDLDLDFDGEFEGEASPSPSSQTQPLPLPRDFFAQSVISEFERFGIDLR